MIKKYKKSYKLLQILVIYGVEGIKKGEELPF